MNATFHLALPCEKIEATRIFYIETLGGREGRSTEKWIDIDLYGNQLTFTNAGPFSFNFKNYKLSGQILPSFHFGIILDKKTFDDLVERLAKNESGKLNKIVFMEARVGQHVSFFTTDPNGYTVEFKSFNNVEEIFRQE